MSYTQFKAFVFKKGWTTAQLRCDVPPTDELLAFMDSVGLNRYESFVIRLEKESQR